MAQTPKSAPAANTTSVKEPGAAFAHSASLGKQNIRKSDGAPNWPRKRSADDADDQSTEAVIRPPAETGPADSNGVQVLQEESLESSANEAIETPLGEASSPMLTSMAGPAYGERYGERFGNPGLDRNEPGQSWLLAQAGAAAVVSDAAVAGAATSGATTAAATASAGTVGQLAGMALGLGAAAGAGAASKDRDAVAPKVAAVGDDTPADVTHEAITFTVTFDEALVGTVGTNNFTATHGTVTSVTRVGSSNAYRVVVMPDAGVANEQVALSLIGTGLADAAGNAVVNADLSSLARQDIDTLAPTLIIESSATTLNLGQTAQITFTFSEDPGSSFSADDVVVTRGTLGPTSGTGLVRTATLTPQSDQTGVQASLAVAAGRYTDRAGNGGAAASGPAIGLETRTEVGIVLQDGYLDGAELWVDMNDNGVIDAEDFRVGTSVDGVVQGYLTAQHKLHALIATGGIDISTGLPFQGSYSATPGSTVVNPLTTLVQSIVKNSVTLTSGMSDQERQTLLQGAKHAAMATVSEALGLPADADLTQIDTIATATGGTESAASGLSLQQALEINSKALMVANMMAVGAAALKGASAETGSAAPSMDTLAGFVVSGIVQAINTAASTGQALALGDSGSLNAILANAGEAAKAGDVTMEETRLTQAIESVSTAVASTNSLIDTLTGNAKASAQTNPAAATATLIQILAAQKAAMEQIEDIKAGDSSTFNDLSVHFANPAAALSQSLLAGSVRLGTAQEVVAPTATASDDLAPQVIAVSVNPERAGDLAQFVVRMSEGVMARK